MSERLKRPSGVEFTIAALDLRDTEDAIARYDQIHFPCGIKTKQGGLGKRLPVGKEVLLTQLQNKAKFKTSFPLGAHHV